MSKPLDPASKTCHALRAQRQRLRVRSATPRRTRRVTFGTATPTLGYWALRRSASASLALSGTSPASACALSRVASRCTATDTAVGSASMSAEKASFSAVFLWANRNNSNNNKINNKLFIII